jgi:hypothetical protein
MREAGKILSKLNRLGPRWDKEVFTLPRETTPAEATGSICAAAGPSHLSPS